MRLGRKGAWFVLVRVIRSGGQTGADRGALDAARELSLPIGGWCPRGGWAEDSPEPPGLLALYPELTETPSSDVIQRTEWNVRDSDATLIVCKNGVATSPGTLATIRFAEELGKPCLVVGEEGASEVLAWLATIDANDAGLDLNVAGPRESGTPGTYELARRLLLKVLQRAQAETR